MVHNVSQTADVINECCIFLRKIAAGTQQLQQINVNEYAQTGEILRVFASHENAAKKRRAFVAKNANDVQHDHLQRNQVVPVVFFFQHGRDFLFGGWILGCVCWVRFRIKGPHV